MLKEVWNKNKTEKRRTETEEFTGLWANGCGGKKACREEIERFPSIRAASCTVILPIQKSNFSQELITAKTSTGSCHPLTTDDESTVIKSVGIYKSPETSAGLSGPCYRELLLSSLQQFYEIMNSVSIWCFHSKFWCPFLKAYKDEMCINILWLNSRWRTMTLSSG